MTNKSFRLHTRFTDNVFTKRLIKALDALCVAPDIAAPGEVIGLTGVLSDDGRSLRTSDWSALTATDDGLAITDPMSLSGPAELMALRATFLATQGHGNLQKMAPVAEDMALPETDVTISRVFVTPHMILFVADDFTESIVEGYYAGEVMSQSMIDKIFQLVIFSPRSAHGAMPISACAGSLVDRALATTPLHDGETGDPVLITIPDLDEVMMKIVNRGAA